MRINFWNSTSRPKCCVIGLGKLGLPLLAVLAESKFSVVGFDSNIEKIAQLNDDFIETNEPKVELLLRKNRKRIQFVNHIKAVNKCDLFFLIVPTPSDKGNKFSNVYVLKALTDLLDSFQSDTTGIKTIVIVSTVMPETCEKIFKPLLDGFNSKTKKVKAVLLYSPEFIALGNVVENLCFPDMTLIGASTKEDTHIFSKVMKKVVKNEAPFVFLSLTEAEIVKILVNCFVTMKISFANFLSEIAYSFGNLDAKKIASALGLDSRIGLKYLTPGLGYGGPCFPRDNNALIAAAREKGLTANLSIATDEINIRQPKFHIDKLLRENSNIQSVGLIGLTYKPKSEVLEKSQMLELAEILSKSGIRIMYFDPLIKKIELADGILQSVNSVSELNNCDLIISTAAFSEFLSLNKNSFQSKFISI